MSCNFKYFFTSVYFLTGLTKFLFPPPLPWSADAASAGHDRRRRNNIEKETKTDGGDFVILADLLLLPFFRSAHQ